MTELAYELDLKSNAEKHPGSIPGFPTKYFTEKGCSHRMESVEKFKSWLKQFFCKHDWVTIGEVSRFTDRNELGVLVECLSEVRECKCCGKRENNFIRIPHG